MIIILIRSGMGIYITFKEVVYMRFGVIALCNAVTIKV